MTLRLATLTAACGSSRFRPDRPAPPLTKNPTKITETPDTEPAPCHARKPAKITASYDTSESHRSQDDTSAGSR